jgi:hypothetical protein
MTRSDLSGIPDLSDQNCTRLMLRMKLLLAKASPGTPVEVIVRRDQRDTLEIPFSRTGYTVEISPLEPDRYLVRLIQKLPPV